MTDNPEKWVLDLFLPAGWVITRNEHLTFIGGDVLEFEAPGAKNTRARVIIDRRIPQCTIIRRKDDKWIDCDLYPIAQRLGVPGRISEFMYPRKSCHFVLDNIVEIDRMFEDAQSRR